MANPLKTIGGTQFREIDSAEENYIAYQIGLQLYSADSTDVGSLSTLADNNIGTYQNTFFGQAVGTHPSTAISTTTTSKILYQRTGTAAETDSDVFTPIMYVDSGGQTGFKEMPALDLNTAIDGYLSKIFTNDYPGTFRLASSAPSGDYEVFHSNIFSDTRTDGTTQNYSIYRRESMTAPTTVRPTRVDKASGFSGIREMNDRQIKYSFGQRAKTRIPASGVGTYELRSSADGAPTATGTWVAKGTALDTKQQTAEQSFTRDSTVNYEANYVRAYTSVYVTNYTKLSQIDYVTDYTGAFNRPYLKDFINVSTINYQTGYQTDYTSLYEIGYIKAYTGSYDQVYLTDYLTDYQTDYEKAYTTLYTANYIRNSEISYTPNYIADYNKVYTGTFTEGYANLYEKEFVHQYQKDYTRTFENPFVHQYQKNYTSESSVTYSVVFATYNRGFAGPGPDLGYMGMPNVLKDGAQYVGRLHTFITNKMYRMGSQGPAYTNQWTGETFAQPYIRENLSPSMDAHLMSLGLYLSSPPAFNTTGTSHLGLGSSFYGKGDDQLIEVFAWRSEGATASYVKTSYTAISGSYSLSYTGAETEYLSGTYDSYTGGYTGVAMTSPTGGYQSEFPIGYQGTDQSPRHAIGYQHGMSVGYFALHGGSTPGSVLIMEPNDAEGGGAASLTLLEGYQSRAIFIDVSSGVFTNYSGSGPNPFFLQYVGPAAQVSYQRAYELNSYEGIGIFNVGLQTAYFSGYDRQVSSYNRLGIYEGPVQNFQQYYLSTVGTQNFIPYTGGPDQLGYWPSMEEQVTFEGYVRTLKPVYDGPPSYDHQQNVNPMVWQFEAGNAFSKATPNLVVVTEETLQSGGMYGTVGSMYIKDYQSNKGYFNAPLTAYGVDTADGVLMNSLGMLWGYDRNTWAVNVPGAIHGGPAYDLTILEAYYLRELGYEGVVRPIASASVPGGGGTYGGPPGIQSFGSSTYIGPDPTGDPSGSALYGQANTGPGLSGIYLNIKWEYGGSSVNYSRQSHMNFYMGIAIGFGATYIQTSSQHGYSDNSIHPPALPGFEAGTAFGLYIPNYTNPAGSSFDGMDEYVLMSQNVMVQNVSQQMRNSPQSIYIQSAKESYQGPLNRDTGQNYGGGGINLPGIGQSAPANYLPTFPAINIGGTIIGSASVPSEGNVEAIGFAATYEPSLNTFANTLNYTGPSAPGYYLRSYSRYLYYSGRGSNSYFNRYFTSPGTPDAATYESVAYYLAGINDYFQSNLTGFNSYFVRGHLSHGVSAYTPVGYIPGNQTIDDLLVNYYVPTLFTTTAVYANNQNTINLVQNFNDYMSVKVIGVQPYLGDDDAIAYSSEMAKYIAGDEQLGSQMGDLDIGLSGFFYNEIMQQDVMFRMHGYVGTYMKAMGGGRVPFHEGLENDLTYNAHYPDSWSVRLGDPEDLGDVIATGLIVANNTPGEAGTQMVAYQRLYEVPEDYEWSGGGMPQFYPEGIIIGAKFSNNIQSDWRTNMYASTYTRDFPRDQAGYFYSVIDRQSYGSYVSFPYTGPDDIVYSPLRHPEQSETGIPQAGPGYPGNPNVGNYDGDGRITVPRQFQGPVYEGSQLNYVDGGIEYLGTYYLQEHGMHFYVPNYTNTEQIYQTVYLGGSGVYGGTTYTGDIYYTIDETYYGGYQGNPMQGDYLRVYGHSGVFKQITYGQNPIPLSYGTLVQQYVRRFVPSGEPLMYERDGVGMGYVSGSYDSPGTSSSGDERRNRQGAGMIMYTNYFDGWQGYTPPMYIADYGGPATGFTINRFNVLTVYEGAYLGPNMAPGNIYIGPITLEYERGVIYESGYQGVGTYDGARRVEGVIASSIFVQYYQSKMLNIFASQGYLGGESYFSTEYIGPRDIPYEREYIDATSTSQLYGWYENTFNRDYEKWYIGDYAVLEYEGTYTGAGFYDASDSYIANYNTGTNPSTGNAWHYDANYENPQARLEPHLEDVLPGNMPTLGINTQRELGIGTTTNMGREGGRYEGAPGRYVRAAYVGPDQDFPGMEVEYGALLNASFGGGHVGGGSGLGYAAVLYDEREVGMVYTGGPDVMPDGQPGRWYNNFATWIYQRVGEGFAAIYLGGPSYQSEYVKGADYVRDFTAQYDMAYTTYYTGTYDVIYETIYERQYDIDYQTDYTGTVYVGTYTGEYEKATPYETQYLTDYGTDYQRAYETGYIPDDYEGPTYEATYATDYTNEFSDTYLTDYETAYTGEYEQSYTSTYETAFTETYTTDYTGNYENQYTRNFEEAYLLDYIGNFIGNFEGLTIQSSSETNETYTLYVRIA